MNSRPEPLDAPRLPQPVSRDPFWRNRRWFVVVTALAVLTGVIFTAASGAPAGETSSWAFDQGTGTTAASSTTPDLDLTLSNGATFDAGLDGLTALALTGSTNARATVNDSLAALTLGADNAQSISFWFNTSANSGVTPQRILAYGVDWRIQFIPSTGSIELFRRDSSSIPTLVASAPGLNDGQWHHAVAVLDAFNFHLYIDGALADSGSLPSIGSHSTGAELVAGASGPTSGDAFVGSIDQLAIYPGTLAAAQVVDLYDDFPRDPVVNSTGDTGDANPGDMICDTGGFNADGRTECTLRAAIEETNASAGLDSISFEIPTADSGHSGGVWTINTADLPAIQAATTVDGSTQTGWLDRPIILIDRSGLSTSGLIVQNATGATIRQLSVTDYTGEGILVSNSSDTTIDGVSLGLSPSGTTGRNGVGLRIVGSDGTKVTDSVISENLSAGISIEGPGADNTEIDGNFIGTDATGTLNQGNVEDGILIDGGDNTVIGGNAANVISANSDSGIQVRDASNTQIHGNLIGVSMTGQALGNTSNGIVLLSGSASTTIEPAADGRPNVIGGNSGRGVLVQDATDTSIRNNFIGTDQAGVANLRNRTGGITVEGSASGAAVIQDNVIKFNSGRGITVDNAVTGDVLIRRNIVFGHSGIGIDLGGDNVTDNDPGDVDTGANGLLNYPEFFDATTTSVGFLFDAPAALYTFTFYANPSGTDSSNHGEGEVLLGEETYNHLGGNRSVIMNLGFSLTPGSEITAQVHTATASSEFARNYVVSSTASNTINPIGDRSHDEGMTVNLFPAGTAGGAAPLNWSASGLPPGLSINASSGEISGTLDFTSAGIYSVQLEAASADAATATENFQWTVRNVNQPPSLLAPGAQTHSEGQPVTLLIVATDPDGDTLTWNAANLPPGLTIDSLSGLISGTLTATSSGLYAVDIDVDDGNGGQDTTSFTWRVNDTNIPPVIDPIGAQSNREADTVSLQVVATDPDPGDGISFSATGLPPGLAINPTSGEIAGTIPFTAAGTYNTMVTASDGTSSSDMSFVWTITNRNRAPSVDPLFNRTDDENTAVSFTPSATDPDGDPIVSWSAIGLPDGITIDGSTGEVSGTLTFESSGSYTTQLSAFDGTNSGAFQFTWTVNDVNRPPTLDPLAALTSAESQAVAIPSNALDADGDVLTWSANSLPPGVVIDSGSGLISGSPSLSSAGVYNVDVVVTDGTDSDTQSFTWTITNTNQAPTITPVIDQFNDEGDTVSVTFDATDADGHPISWTAAGLPAGVAVSGNQAIGTLSFTTAGTYDVTVTASDGNGGVSTDNFAWVVADVNRSPILSPLPDRTDAENAATSLFALATDPDGNSLTWSATNLPPGIVIDQTSGEMSGAPTFSAEGTYVTSVSINDGNGGSDTTSFVWTINNTNRAPTVSSTFLLAHREGEIVSASAQATDPDGDPIISWAATGLPSGISINPVTGQLTGTLNYASAGVYFPTFTASDGDLTGQQSIVWIVFNTNRAPVLTSIADRIGIEGMPSPTFVAAASDPDGDSITWSANGLPNGLTIDAATGEINGTPTAPSTYDVEVTVTDSPGAQDRTTFEWTISPTATTTVPPAPTTTTTTSTTTTVAPTTTTTSTTTTVAPTTTTTTTTSTTSTTVAPTTTSTTSTTVAPTTTTVAPTTTAASTPSTTSAPTPPETVPSAIAFRDLETVDDRIAANDDSFRIDVLANDIGNADLRVTSLTQPTIGSASLNDDGTITLTIPRSYAGQTSLTYTATDASGAQSTATIDVFSLNVLAPAGRTASSTPAETVDSFADVYNRIGDLFGGLVQIRLNSIQLLAVSLTPLLLVLVHFLLRRRDVLMSVTSVDTLTRVPAAGQSGSVHEVRHDALLWSTTKTRKRNDRSETQVELADGRTGWIATELLTDTEY